MSEGQNSRKPRCGRKSLTETCRNEQAQRSLKITQHAKNEDHHVPRRSFEMLKHRTHKQVPKK